MIHDTSSQHILDDYENLYKLVLIGDMGVGKTHLLERYKTG